MLFFRLLLLVPCIALSAQTVRISVFSLFHPQQLTVRSASVIPILVRNATHSQTLEGSQTAQFRLSGISQADISSTSGTAADIFLRVPSKIERRYHGTIHISRSPTALLAIVEMDREVAVASIVAAEITPGAPLEALKAQAVVARSFLSASEQRHQDFQFCDTTHCQFLRTWPAPDTTAFRAAEETRGMLLTYQGTPIAPLYSAACGGHTLALEVPQPGSHGYLYRAVACDFCLRHARDPVRGHRLGLCQQGASGMARDGEGFRQILNHYYPGTAVTNFSTQ